MAPGRKTLRQVLFGKETTPGTQVAATARWRGTGSLKDTIQVARIEEEVGKLGGTNRSVVTRLGGELSLEGVATFEQLPYFLAMAFGGPVTGVQDGAGTDYLYTTNFAEGTLPTITTYTFEAGDDAEALEFGYGYCSEFTLSGAAGEVVKLSAKIRGQEVTTATFTAGISLPAVSEILVSMGKCYVDLIGGSFGGTQVSNQVLAFEITFKPIIPEKMTLDGVRDFSFVTYTGHEITGRLTFEHDTAALLATSGGVHNAFASQTAKKLQLKLIHTANVTTPGTTYSQKTLIINLPIKWTGVSELGDQDGNATIDGEFISQYDPTADDSGAVIIANEVSALP